MTSAITPLVALCAALALVPAGAAETTPPPQGIVSLSSSASVEVTKDLLSITFSTTREGLEAAEVQSQLQQALDAALTVAQRAARAGQLEVSTGNFSLSPRYTKSGTVSGWQGSAELIVQGRDLQAITELSSRITTLTVQRVGYELSRELRERSEGEVASQAIERFRAKAADYAKQFGYAGYTIREVNVSSSEPPIGRPMADMRIQSASVSAEMPLPVAPGKGSVTVSVGGSVQLK